MSSWAVPRDTWQYAIGNSATCNYQGFLLQLAIGAPLFNASLGLYYALLIRMKWTDKMLAQIEKYIHGVIWTFSIGTSFALLPLKQYNQIGQVCWIIGYPSDCGDSTHIGNPDVPCERGDHAWLYGIFTFYGPLWICVACCLVCMLLVYLEVRKTVTRVRRYSFDVRTSRNMGRSQMDAVAIQAILYTVSFFITWMPSTLWSVAHWFRFAAFWLDFLSAFCEPLQGMWNFLIFIRARRRTKIKIKKAIGTIFPFLKASLRDTDLSRDRSGNGGRSFGENGSQTRSTHLADSSVNRSTIFRSSQMNESLQVNKASTSNVSVSFCEENSLALTSIPESSPDPVSMVNFVHKSIPEDDEASIESAIDASKSPKSMTTLEETTVDDSGSVQPDDALTELRRPGEEGKQDKPHESKKTQNFPVDSSDAGKSDDTKLGNTELDEKSYGSDSDSTCDVDELEVKLKMYFT